MRDMAQTGVDEPRRDPAGARLVARLRADGVAVEKPGEVGVYFSAHARIGWEVERLSRSARERLGTKASFALELVRDPDIDDEQLALYVRQAEYDADLLDVFDEVVGGQDGDLSLASGRVTLTTDFQPPR